MTSVSSGESHQFSFHNIQIEGPRDSRGRLVVSKDDLIITTKNKTSGEIEKIEVVKDGTTKPGTLQGRQVSHQANDENHIFEFGIRSLSLSLTSSGPSREDAQTDTDLTLLSNRVYEPKNKYYTDKTALDKSIQNIKEIETIFNSYVEDNGETKRTLKQWENSLIEQSIDDEFDNLILAKNDSDYKSAMTSLRKILLKENDNADSYLNTSLYIMKKFNDLPNSVEKSMKDRIERDLDTMTDNDKNAITQRENDLKQSVTDQFFNLILAKDDNEYESAISSLKEMISKNESDDISYSAIKNLLIKSFKSLTVGVDRSLQDRIQLDIQKLTHSNRNTTIRRENDLKQAIKNEFFNLIFAKDDNEYQSAMNSIREILSRQKDDNDYLATTGLIIKTFKSSTLGVDRSLQDRIGQDLANVIDRNRNTTTQRKQILEKSIKDQFSFLISAKNDSEYNSAMKSLREILSRQTDDGAYSTVSRIIVKTFKSSTVGIDRTLQDRIQGDIEKMIDVRRIHKR